MIKHLFATPSNPVRLVKPGDEGAIENPDAPLEGEAITTEPAPSPTAQAALEVATNWWIMTPVVLVAVAALLTIHLRIARYRRLTPEERAFRALARRARTPMKYRVLLRRLADAPGSPPPIATLCSDGALIRAAAMLESKPKSSTDRVLREYLKARGLLDNTPADGGARTKASPAPTRLDTAA